MKKHWIFWAVCIVLVGAVAAAWLLQEEPEPDPNEIVTVYCLSEVRQSRNGEEMWTQDVFSYDEYGNMISHTHYYDEVTGYDPEVTEYAYDERGNLICQCDRYAKTVYTYDENDRVLSENRYDGHNGEHEYSLSYEYDEAGHIIYEREARFSRTEITVTEHINTYDDIGNLIKIESTHNGVPGSTQVNTFDDKNRLIKTEHSNQGQVFETVTYTYDRAGRLLSYIEDHRTRPEETVERYYQYDLLGNKISYKRYIGGRLVDEETNIYDLAGRLTSETKMRGTSLSYQASYFYNIFGRLVRKVAQEPPEISIGYAPAQYQVIYDYAYDLWGNLVKQVREDEALGRKVTTWQYDRHKNRVVFESGDNHYEWTYDQEGNMVEKYLRFSEDSERRCEYRYITFRVPRWLAEKIQAWQAEFVDSGPIFA